MILKDLDNHEKDLEILNSFLQIKDLPNQIKAKVLLEIKKIQAGVKAQKEVAFELKFHYENSKNVFVIHDLRLEYNGKIAQIDHLVINRYLECIVCESKNFSEGVSYNDNYEFSAYWNGKPYGIYSPIEQNKKHILVIEEICKNNIITLPRRLGFKMNLSFINFILVSNNAIISRGKDLPKNIFLLKSDQFFDKYKDENRSDLSSTIGDISKIVSSETLEILALSLVNLHKPIQFNWHEKFGINNFINNNPETLLIELPKAIKSTKKYCCEVCNNELDGSVLFWCRKNKLKFSGKLLCREHQPK